MKELLKTQAAMEELQRQQKCVAEVIERQAIEDGRISIQRPTQDQLHQPGANWDATANFSDPTDVIDIPYDDNDISLYLNNLDKSLNDTMSRECPAAQVAPATAPAAPRLAVPAPQHNQTTNQNLDNNTQAMVQAITQGFAGMKKDMERIEKATTAAKTPPQPPVQVQNGELGFSNSQSNVPVVSTGGPPPAPTAPTTFTPLPADPAHSTVTRLNAFMSVNIDVELRKKCINNDFIELYDLIKRFKLDNDPNEVTWYADIHGSYTMKTRRSKQIYDINDWNLAMAIYSDILIDAQTEVNSVKLLTRGLIKYQQEIRDVAVQYPPSVWVRLDREYRAIQANFPNERTWHTFEPDVYQKILNKAMLEAYGPAGPRMHYPQQPAQYAQPATPFAPQAAQATTYTPKAQKPAKKSKNPYSRPPGAPNLKPVLKTCMYFQQNRCRRGPETCTFTHHCSLCKSTAHGKFACPQNPRNQGQ